MKLGGSRAIDRTGHGCLCVRGCRPPRTVTILVMGELSLSCVYVADVNEWRAIWTDDVADTSAASLSPRSRRLGAVEDKVAASTRLSP